MLSCDWLQNFCPGRSVRTKTTKKSPSNIKPCNYKHNTFDSRKCTEAGINSCITVPSKVCASQDPTKKRVTCSCKSVHRIVRLGWGQASAPLQRQVLFVYNWSEHSACSTSLDENAVGRSILLRSKTVNFKGTLFSVIFWCKQNWAR